EPVVLPAVGVPAPPDRLDDARCGRFPPRAGVPAALGGGEQRLRAHVRRAGGLPLLRPRPRAGLRPPVADRRGSAPMRRRRALLVASLFALVAPAQAFAHATLEHTSPGFRQRLERSPKQIRLEFDQGVKAFPNSIKVYDANGHVFSGAAASGGR